MREGPYEAVISFLPRELVRQYIEECIISAVIAATDGEPLQEVSRLFLTHREQRFRLNYILGNPNLHNTDEESETDLDDELHDDLSDELEDMDTSVDSADSTIVSLEERKKLESQLKCYIDRIYNLSELTKKIRKEVQTELDVEELANSDREAFEELVEKRIQEHTTFTNLIDEIMDEVEIRFDFIKQGSYKHDTSGWPIIWHYQSTDRETFLRQVNRFSSNYAMYFGRLLTPIVQGMRVSGEFPPTWYDNGIPHLVLIDGEGLGHTPESTSSLPTEVTRRFELVDAIVLVDDASQPLQAAPSAALRSVATRGYESKLLLAFTHFDQVIGDNLPTVIARKDHVISSLDNCLSKLGESVKGIEKSLQRHLSKHTFFLSNIQNPLPASARLTRQEIGNLLDTILLMTKPSGHREVKPFYDEPHLVICVHKATQRFHDSWNAILGLAHRPGTQKEHWARIKALSRRYAERMSDEYLWLRPVADISQFLSEHIYVFLESPLRWEPDNATEEEKKAAINKIAQEIEKRLQKYVSKRLYVNPIQEWSHAYYSRYGRGSTFWRARDIQSIYLTQTPIPAESPTPTSNAFLRMILNLVQEGVKVGGGQMIQK